VVERPECATPPEKILSGRTPEGRQNFFDPSGIKGKDGRLPVVSLRSTIG